MADEEPAYTIAAAARKLGVHPQTLRNWDRSGLYPARRTLAGYRYYTEADLEAIRVAMWQRYPRPGDESGPKTTTSHRDNPVTGGHAPGHLRDLFLAGLSGHDGPWPNGLAGADILDAVPAERRDWWRQASVNERARWLTGQLWDCTDTLPAGDCESLDLPRGSTYAQAARSLRRQLR